MAFFKVFFLWNDKITHNMNIMSIQQKILDFENEFDKFTTFTIRYEKISIITLKILKLLITGYIRKNCSFYLARARQLALVSILPNLLAEMWEVVLKLLWWVVSCNMVVVKPDANPYLGTTRGWNITERPQYFFLLCFLLPTWNYVILLNKGREFDLPTTYLPWDEDWRVRVVETSEIVTHTIMFTHKN